jgi:hypothetical protein
VSLFVFQYLNVIEVLKLAYLLAATAAVLRRRPIQAVGKGRRAQQQASCKANRKLRHQRAVRHQGKLIAKTAVQTAAKREALVRRRANKATSVATIKPRLRRQNSTPQPRQCNVTVPKPTLRTRKLSPSYCAATERPAVGLSPKYSKPKVRLQTEPVKAVEATLVAIEAAGLYPAQWVNDSYQIGGGSRTYRSAASQEPDEFYQTHGHVTFAGSDPLQSTAEIAADPELVVPGQLPLKSTTNGDTMTEPEAITIVTAENVRAFDEVAFKTGTKGIIQEFIKPRAIRESHAFANSIMAATCHIRGAADQAFEYPEVFHKLVVLGVPAIIPECEREDIPGGNNLNLLLSLRQMPTGGSYILREANTSEVGHSLRNGTLFHSVGFKANDKRAIAYADIIEALTNPPSEKHKPVEVIGYKGFEATFLASRVFKVLLLSQENITVVITPQVHKALTLVLKVTGATIKATYVTIPANWLLPVANIAYEDAVVAFSRIDFAARAAFNSQALQAPGRSPFHLAVHADKFVITLGGGSKLTAHKPTDERPAIVYHQAQNSEAEFSLRGAVIATPNLQGAVPVDHCAHMQPLDMLWYAFESFIFSNLNRACNNANKRNKTQEGLGTFAARFIQTCLPVRYEEGQVVDKVYNNRVELEQAKFDLVVTAMPMLLHITRDAAGLVVEPNGLYHSWLYNYAGDKAPNPTTVYYSAIKESASLTNGKANALAMVPALNQLNLALVPTGDVQEAISGSLVRIKLNGVIARCTIDPSSAATKARFRKLISSLWSEFAPTFGKYDANSDLQLVQAIWTKPEIAALMKANNLSPHEASSSRAHHFWEILGNEFVVLLSGKQSKVVKRIVMTYSVSCKAKNSVVIGVRAHHKQEISANLVPAVVLPNMKAEPGNGVLTENFIKAYYTQKLQVAQATQATGLHAYIELVPELAAVATERYVQVDENTQVLSSYMFPDKLKVTKDQYLGTVMMGQVGVAGGGIACEKMYAPNTGYLSQVLMNTNTGVGGEETFFVNTKIVEQVTNALKLRSIVALKLNVIAGKIWHFLNPKRTVDLNGESTRGVDMIVYGDSYKGSDNLTSLVKLAGVNLHYHGAANPELLELLVDTNYAVQALLGEAPWRNADYLHVVPALIPEAVYANAVAKFQELFETNVWHYKRVVEADLPTIQKAHTYNRAIAAIAAAAIPDSKLQGSVWRGVGSAEAATILGNNNNLPANLIDEIAAQEKAGTYMRVDAAVGSAFIVTNAVGEITETDHISCQWSEMQSIINPAGDKLPNIRVAHYCMLDRSYGWGPKDGLQMMYPVEVESVPITKSVSDTSATSFALIQHGLDGTPELATSHLNQVAENTKFDGLVRSMLSNYAIATDSGNSLHDLSAYTGNLAVDILGPVGGAVMDYFTNPAVYQNSTQLMAALAKMFGDDILRIPTSDGTMTVHVATLYDWNKGSLRQGGQSALKALAAWFKIWISGENPRGEKLMSIAGSFRAMLGKFYNGKNNMKSMLRGNKSVYMKAQACSLVPSHELWINEADAAHYCAVFGVDDVRLISAVAIRRMPMFASNISRLRVLTKTDLNYYRKEYGVFFAAGLAYMGSAQMYANFGDLDGDAIEIGNMSKEFAVGICQLDNFKTVTDMLASVLGVDSLVYTYWLKPHADQYIADHFMIDTWSKFQSKSKISWKANCTTSARFEQLQHAAGAVQSVTVGLTYRAATLSLMLAEILPKVWEHIVKINGGITPAWLQSFTWTRDIASAKIMIARIVQLYEVALGGYDVDMAKVTLGYLIRIMSASASIDYKIPGEIANAIQATGQSSNLTPLLPALADFRKSTHLNLNEVTAAFETLGFSSTDIPVFRDCFMLSGLCTSYTRSKELQSKLFAVAPDLCLVFDIIQTVLDISQVKLDADFNVLGYNSYKATIEYAQEIAAVNGGTGDNALLGDNLLELGYLIETSTITGKLLAHFKVNNDLIDQAFLANKAEEGTGVFYTDTLPSVK